MVGDRRTVNWQEPDTSLVEPSRKLSILINRTSTAKFLAAWITLALLGSLGIRPLFALTVRVESPDGAPRLVVNGKLVRARMFWGCAGSAPLQIGPVAKEESFEFTASGNATTGTLHFRFGPKPGAVDLDAIVIADLDSGRAVALRDWVAWPPQMAAAAQCANGAIHVQLIAPTDGQRPDFHVYSRPDLVITEGHRYRVSFRVRADVARELITAVYRPGQPYVRLGGPGGVFESQIKLAAGVGVNFVSFPVALPWPEPGEPADWTQVDRACQMVLQANPQALLLPRIDMDPPDWWGQTHPDDVMQWDDGRRAKAVPASPQYRRDAAERLAALVGHLEMKFGENVAGYHPAGQNTGEWFYEGTWERPLNGYAPADFTAWRQWLKAHRKPDAPVPTPAERRSAEVFASPSLVDWAQFQQEAMADCVCELAKAAREASRGRKLVVFFYGYVFEFGPVANGPATSGHYALRRVLDCPDIDVLCSPISYFDRGLGQSAPSMTAAESVALAGKLWLNEDDTYTYLASGNPPGWQDHVATLADTNAELVRNVAQEALRNFGTWWMDLGETGWFNDPGMWAEMQRLQELDEQFLKKPTPFRPEVAVVIDENRMLRVAPGGCVAVRKALCEVRAPLGRMGAPYGQYLLDDVLAGRVRAKLYVFVNGWCYSSDERKRLAGAVPGLSLFVEAAGLTSETLRQAAHTAGVHLFTQANCVVYANGRFLALHAVQDGPLAIDTGAAGPVRDVLTGEIVGDGPKLSLPIQRGETRVLTY